MKYFNKAQPEQKRTNEKQAIMNEEGEIINDECDND